MFHSENEDMEDPSHLSFISTIFNVDSKLSTEQFVDRADDNNNKWAFSGSTIREKFEKISDPKVLALLEEE